MSSVGCFKVEHYGIRHAKAVRMKKLYALQQRGLIFLVVCLLVPSAVAQTAGCCTKTATASCGPADRFDYCTVSPAITFIEGNNAGSGSCNIPTGAIISRCTVTITNPLVDGSPSNLTHLNVTVISGSAGAMLNMNNIGAGWSLNWDALGGVPVNGLFFLVRFTGTGSCSGSHNHTASVTISVNLCWQVPASVSYQATEGMEDTYLGNCMSNLDCDATLPHVFADNGTQASGGLYSNNVNAIYRTFCPNATGKCMSAEVQYYSIEAGYDYLTILNGPTQNSATLATLTGAKDWGTPVIYTSSDSSGCLGFRFTSDDSYTYGGFYINLHCSDCNVANNLPSSDCEGAIAACGNTAFSGSANGPGLSSTCAGCMLTEHYTTWYYFETATPGVLSLTVDAFDNADDYDFALYEADACPSLGSPIRCSYAAINASGSTGMSASAGDVSEDVSGDGWVSTLSTQPNQRYYLMVNNWSPGDAGFNLTFQLDGGTFRECSILPVSLVDFSGACSNGRTTLTWSTASETNNDYWLVMRSVNQEDFQVIGTVPGAGNSNTLQTYAYTDENLDGARALYKLMQTDYDGHHEASKTIEVSCGPSGDNIRVADFQSQGYVLLEIPPELGKVQQIRLVSTAGSIAYTAYPAGVDGELSLKLPVANLRPGIYIVQVTTASQVYHRRVLIH